MIDIINGLLNVSRIELGSFVLELSEQNIYEVIQSIIHDLRPALDKKQMRLEHLYQSSNPCLLIDESLFRMVTTNLLTNAINYTATGGLVKIEERLANQGQSLAGKFLAEDYLVVIISDTGCGIPPNQQGKLFTKFFRADNAIEKHPDGTGLGLYIVKSLLDNTGGLIWFTSQENQGSTFYVAIPLSGMRSRVDENK
jgi:signal transduction histidine kinase